MTKGYTSCRRVTQSVADYYATLTPEQLHTMRELLDFVVAEFPQLEVKIAWNKPHVHVQGKYVLGVDAARKHLMFHPWSVPVFERFLPRLTGYVTGKRTFQIPLGWQLDQALIRDIVTAQLAEMA
jgi:uncharacterized protein YdhG (YjbR/CyaY superfamily)